MPIYTKTGDKGITSLGTGERVWKNSKRVESYGLVDELNAILGLIVSELDRKKYPAWKYLIKLLSFLQNDLFAIGSYLANPKSTDLIEGLANRTQYFEKQIDFMTKKMPSLRNFIFPGGGKIGSLLHIARTVARRVERTVVFLSREQKVNEDVLIYINRISDLFLVMARYANYAEGKKETIWSRQNNRI